MYGYDERDVIEEHHESSFYVNSKTERTILPDLRSYPFDDEVKHQADIIYNKMRPRVRRGRIRLQMLFYCVYCAHRHLGRVVNPISLGAKFGLKQGEIQRCDSIFSALQTGFRAPQIDTPPHAYFPDFCEKMELSEAALESLVTLTDSVMRKDCTLTQDNPQTVAAGFLKYYVDINGIVLQDNTVLSRVTGRSNVTIDNMYRRIAVIDNK